MTSSVTVRHNFECGHRLPHIGGKCTNLHGHSWWATITAASPELAAGTVIEFGAFKKKLREWIDTNLDHGLMLGTNDPLVSILPEFGKVYAFGLPGSLAEELSYPTVENVAVLLSRVGERILTDTARAPGTYISRVEVQETHVNAATWEA